MYDACTSAGERFWDVIVKTAKFLNDINEGITAAVDDFAIGILVDKGIKKLRGMDKADDLSKISTKMDDAKEVYWCDDWGEKPENERDIAKMVREKLKNAPKLLPIYAHRYMPMLLDDQPPVVSIHNIDIIYYGENLEDYFEVEFGKKSRKR